MKSNRYLLLIISGLVMVFLLGGGLFVRVGAADSSFRQSVLFAEVLSLVMENYVDPVEADGLLEGAYEGMLGGLDPNGAFMVGDRPTDIEAGLAAGATPILVRTGYGAQAEREANSNALQAEIIVDDLGVAVGKILGE